MLFRSLEFDGISVDDWEYLNPKPKSKAKLKLWQKERESIKKEYEVKIEDWRKLQEVKKKEAKKKELKAFKDEMNACFEEKKADWEEENRIGKDELTHIFYQNDEKYTVFLNKDSENFMGKRIDDVWEVNFEGPKGFSTTNLFKGAFTIYRKVLLAVKKLMETHTVNGIAVSPAEPAMMLVYQKFYKQLLSEDFIQVTENLFLRKSYLAKLKLDKKEVSTEISLKKKEIENNIKDIEEEKKKEREARVLFKPGTLVQARDLDNNKPYPAVIVEKNYQYGTVYYRIAELKGTLLPSIWMNSRKAKDLSLPLDLPREQIQKFLTLLKSQFPDVYKLTLQPSV